jgi:hypothetical protein
MPTVLMLSYSNTCNSIQNVSLRFFRRGHDLERLAVNVLIDRFTDQASKFVAPANHGGVVISSRYFLYAARATSLNADGPEVPVAIRPYRGEP